MVSDRLLLRQRSLGGLLLLALLLLGTGLGLRDPWPADEPRFALAALQMVQSDQWLFPMRGGELYADKPPLFMWAIALGYQLTGSLRIAFLLPSLCAALLILALVWDLGRRLWSRETGFSAGLLLLFTLQFTLQAKTAQIDLFATAFVMLALYALLRFLLCGDGWRWYWLGWFAAGLGVISKGIGVLALLVLLPALLTHWQAVRASRWRAWLAALAGPPAMAAAMALWLAPMLLAVSQSGDPQLLAYRDEILLRQTVTRYFDAWHHLKPFWYYVTEVIPLFWLPLSLLLPWLIPEWVKAVRSHDRRFILLLGYLLLVLLLFSFSAGKRGVYLTPATPALALLAAPLIGRVLQRRWPARLLLGLGMLLGLVGMGGALALRLSERLLARLDGEGEALWLPLLLFGLLALLLTLRLRRAPLTAVCAVLGAGWLIYSGWICVQLNTLRTPAAIMAEAAARLPPQGELLVTGFKEQQLLFARSPLRHYGYRLGGEEQGRAAAAWVAGAPMRRVLGPSDIMGQCFEPAQMTRLGHRHRTDWWLADAAALKASCRGLPITLEPYRYRPVL